MTYQLTLEQSLLWEIGHWEAYRIEEDVIEDLERRDITEQVIVLLDTGAVAFAITLV